MTAFGTCQTRPSSPSAAVSWATAKPCMGCWLRMASTSHSDSDIDGSAVMTTSLAGGQACAGPRRTLEGIRGDIPLHRDPARLGEGLQVGGAAEARAGARVEHPAERHGVLVGHRL